MSQAVEMYKAMRRIRVEIETKQALMARCPYVVEIAMMQDILFDGVRFAWRYTPSSIWSQAGPFQMGPDDYQDTLNAVATCMRMEKP